MDNLILDGEHLTLEQVVEVAHGAPKGGAGDKARAKVERAAKAVETMLSEGRVAHGITTGSSLTAK